MSARQENRIRRLERDSHSGEDLASWWAVPIEEWPDEMVEKLLNRPQSDQVIRSLSDTDLRTLIRWLGIDTES